MADEDKYGTFTVTFYLNRDADIEEFDTLINDGVLFSPNDSLTDHYVIHEPVPDIVHDLSNDNY